MAIFPLTKGCQLLLTAESKLWLCLYKGCIYLIESIDIDICREISSTAPWEVCLVQVQVQYNIFWKTHPSSSMLCHTGVWSCISPRQVWPSLYSIAHKSLEQAVAQHLASSLTRSKVCSRHVWCQARPADGPSLIIILGKGDYSAAHGIVCKKNKHFTLLVSG